MPVPGAETLSPTFHRKLTEVARRLGTDPQHLLGVMSWETGGTFRPDIRNQAGSGATGLIQFLPETARALGTSTKALARMTPEEQLDYVEQYLTPYRGKLGSFQDTYMAVLSPKAMGQRPDYTLFRGGTTAYQQNAGLDESGQGRVTIGDTMRRVGRFLGSAVSPGRAEAATTNRDDELFQALGVPEKRSAAVPQGQTPPTRDDELWRALGVPERTRAAPGEPEPAAPAPSVGAPDPRQGYDVEVRPGSTGTPAPRASDTSLPAMAGRALTRAGQYVRESLTGPIPQEMYAPQPAPELLGQIVTGPNVGELVGQTVGSAVMPGAGTAIGGTIGAVIGKTAETLLQEGRLPSWKEIGTEAAWSLLPEAAESLGRLGLRTIARGTRGGQIIRFDEAARRARALPEVFEAQTREQVGSAFEAVRQSGVQIDTTALRQEIQGLRPGKYADVMAELRRMDRDMKTGNRYQQLFQNLRQTGGVQVTGMPIGDLQQLRSGLRVRIDQLEHTEARQLLRDVQRAVDDAVDQGIARGRTAAGQTPEQLQQARREWARVRASEDMGDLIERTITTTPDLSMASFNLRQFADAMRRNTGDLAQSVNRSLDQVPGARARFLREMDDIARLYQTAELPMADVFGIWRMPGFAMVRQWISQAMLSDTGRQLFRQAMLEGRGRVSLNGLAAAVNAGRREVGLEPLVIPEREGDLPPSAPAPTQGPGS